MRVSEKMRKKLFRRVAQQVLMRRLRLLDAQQAFAIELVAVTVAKLGNQRRAALMLDISQASVSKMLDPQGRFAGAGVGRGRAKMAKSKREASASPVGGGAPAGGGVPAGNPPEPEESQPEESVAENGRLPQPAVEPLRDLAYEPTGENS